MHSLIIAGLFEVCIRAKWPIKPELILVCVCSMKQLSVYLKTKPSRNLTLSTHFYNALACKKAVLMNPETQFSAISLTIVHVQNYVLQCH